MFSAQLFQIKKIDEQLMLLKKQVDSITFISGSFCNSCKEKGFHNLDEWKVVCKKMWKLEEIEWSCFKSGEELIYFGKWNGPYGRGEVYEK